MFACGGSIAFPLQRARQPEFRRCMKGVQRQPFLKRRDGLVILLRLRVQVAGKIIGVSFFGRDLRDVQKSGNPLLRLSKVLVHKSEVVPGISIVGNLLRRRFERRARRLQLLLREQRDTQIHTGHRKLGGGFQRLIKIFLRVRGALLVHVRRT